MPLDIKKSLLITLSFPPSFGGEQAYYYNVAKNFPPDKIVVLAPQHPAAKKFDHQQKFPIIRYDMKNLLPKKGLAKIFQLRGSASWLSMSKVIDTIVKNHQIEIIQAGQILPLGTVAMLHWRKKKTPYIFYAHGLDITFPKKIMRKKILMEKIIKNAQGIVANSYFTKDELVDLKADKSKIVVSYPCPNITATEPPAWELEKFKKNHGLEGKKIILTVGRLVLRKGHDMVIKALPQIIKQVPSISYVIVGDGPNKKPLQQLVNKNNLGEHVKFVGAVNKEELSYFFAASDVFIMPNRMLNNGDVEGFGIVFLEAGLYGKPVIGGNNGGVPEAIIDNKTGLLVDPQNLTDIAQKTIKLLTDDHYAARLGLQGLHHASEFHWPEQVEKIKTLLKNG